MALRIKSWATFQHFKDRTPPWIKLYRDLLDDPDWHELDAEASKVLVMLWLIASEDKTQQGRLPDVRKMAFRLRIKEEKLNQALTKLSHWVEQDDIKPISERYQSDAPETETETEGETELETDIPPSEVGKTGKPVLPPCPIEEIISVYHETLPVLPRFQVRNETRDGYIRARWRQFFTEGDFETKEAGIDCFRWFFDERVKPSKFLTGQSEGRNGKRPFVADLEWLMKPSNFAKVVEGKYT